MYLCIWTEGETNKWLDLYLTWWPVFSRKNYIEASQQYQNTCTAKKVVLNFAKAHFLPFVYCLSPKKEGKLRDNDQRKLRLDWFSSMPILLTAGYPARRNRKACEPFLTLN